MTIKYLFQLLFKAFAFAFALSFIIGSAYYIVTFKSGNYLQALPSITTGSLTLTMILTLMEFAIMFFQYHSVYSNLVLRLILFFGGTIGFMAFVFTQHMGPSNTVFYAATGISFFVVQSVLYFLMVKKYPPSAMVK